MYLCRMVNDHGKSILMGGRMVGPIKELVLDAYLITKTLVDADPKRKWHMISFANKWKIIFKKCIVDRNILTLEMATILIQINI